MFIYLLPSAFAFIHFKTHPSSDYPLKFIPPVCSAVLKNFWVLFSHLMRTHNHRWLIRL